MTRIRKKPAGYVTLIVKPVDGFDPSHWQRVPSSYRIIEFAGFVPLLGQADSWKFLNNQAAMRSGDLSRWAIHISLDSAESTTAMSQLKQDLARG
ncbi:MAG: hypothetical protein AAFN77_06320 [Planctomycetota bacterium]